MYHVGEKGDAKTFPTDRNGSELEMDPHPKNRLTAIPFAVRAV